MCVFVSLFELELPKWTQYPSMEASAVKSLKDALAVHRVKSSGSFICNFAQSCCCQTDAD